MPTCSLLAVIVLAVLAPAAPGLTLTTGTDGPPLDDLGSITFPNSGAAEAQPWFLYGMLLLHSFEYDDAAEAFAEARRIDPAFVLAYWGEALTHYHPLWNQVEREEALAVLDGLAPNPEQRVGKCLTRREAGLMAAVDVLFAKDDDEHRARLAYSEAMGRLADAHPDDHEIQALYSVSILGTARHGRDTRIYMRAAAVAEEVYAENPRHPGALHYLIHSYDDPEHAPLGLRMARRYDVVAPAAAHALHMPSHIYVALGMWDESERANVASAAAADARRERKGLDLQDRGYHALWWLLYTRLQQGRIDAARALLDDMVRDTTEHDSDRTRFHLAAMRAAWLIDTEEWDGPAAAIDVELDNLAYATANDFATAYGAWKQGDQVRAEELRQRMRTRILDVLGPLTSDGDVSRDPVTGRRPEADPSGDESATGGSLASCCLPAATVAGPLQPGRRAALVMEKQLEGLLLLAEGREVAALLALEEAAAGEDAMTYDFGPPVVVKPTHELLGEVLLELGRPGEAVTQFQAALARAPRRSRSLLGLAHAAEAAGEQQLAAGTWAELDLVWGAADESRRALVPTPDTPR